MSTKPSFGAAGAFHAPLSVAATGGLPRSVLDDTVVVPFNDITAREQALAPRDVACFVVEPVMQNIGICMPA